jgi:DNA-directed RNA polymerase specialized sigma24 family protein
MVAFRLDHRLQGRIDPSDVLQDAYIEAWKDLQAYLRRPKGRRSRAGLHHCNGKSREDLAHGE